MPKPYEFKSEAELVEMLHHQNTIDATKSFYSVKSLSISEVVHTGVTGNTFRAFRKLRVKPSVTFREWATNYLQQTQEHLIGMTSQDAYSIYVHVATLSLCDHWRKLTESEMGYGRGAKLFNLVLKKFACLHSLTDTQKNTLISLQHVPLDSYTIIGLRTAAPELSIPRNATMKFIKEHIQYDAFQEKISAISAKAGVPAIYYDILAWDMGH